MKYILLMTGTRAGVDTYRAWNKNDIDTHMARAKIPPFISPRVRTWLLEFPTLRKSRRVGFSRRSIYFSRDYCEPKRWPPT